MRLAITFTLLALLQAAPPAPPKATDNSGSSNVQTQTTQGETPPANPTNQKEQEVQKPRDDTNGSEHIIVDSLPKISTGKDVWDKSYIVFTGLLVVIGSITLGVGGITLALIWYQARETARAAKAAADSVEAINKQAGIMERQTGATEKAAEAARDGVEATKQSIELLISEKRARIRVEIGKLTIYPAGHALPIHEVSYKVVSYGGATHAFISEARATVQVTNSVEPPTAIVSTPVSLPSVINPNEALERSAIIFQPIEENVLNKVNARELFVHFHGFIKYRDVFERERETRFRYRWRVTDLKSLDGSVFAYWEKIPEDNIET